MEIIIVHGDITNLRVDAIVNAANSSLMGGSGVDGAIHRKGGREIAEECREIVRRQGECPPGEARITTAGNLPAKYVIHTVGPIWRGGGGGEAHILEQCYRNSLALAEQSGVRSIAFPNISTGVYHYPRKQAAELALRTLLQYTQNTNRFVQEIHCCCYETENYQIYMQLFNHIKTTEA